jgi:hypothetical protein
MYILEYSGVLSTVFYVAVVTATATSKNVLEYSSTQYQHCAVVEYTTVLVTFLLLEY